MQINKDLIISGTGVTLEETINQPDIYSTAEIKTDKTWINGKPIYRKSFRGKFGQSSYSHGIANVEEYISITGTFSNGFSNQFTIPCVRVGYPDRAVGIYANSTFFAFDAGSAIDSSYSFAVTLEYTKTTD